ncbi:MAG: hypothetical protein GWN55_10485, partial [Phycisphaerae bacterium]|nr:hypothetical protein [candidate division KSB1 bacterium]NIV01728.1 hypothetical protein [Phycisphaerae bacterium]NIV70133.1 hypothetical protein [Phycisphaerae bacterium]NIW20865.1 hypothetical protein [candidate division KSB1 bacterium]NIW71332.1 hypothetical protein [candidate division KSB1 bacterium]
YLVPLIAEANQRLKMHRELLDDYHQVAEQYFSEPDLSPELRMMYLTLRRGILYEESNVQWAEEALAVLMDLHENNNKST